MNPKTIGLVLMLVAMPAIGQNVYKCQTPEGTIKFQQVPCAGAGEAVTVTPTKPSGDGGLREGEKDLLSKTNPELRLKMLEKDLADAQVEADAAREKANAAHKEAETARRAERDKK